MSNDGDLSLTPASVHNLTTMTRLNDGDQTEPAFSTI